jgi:hypothetical protein
VGLPISSYVFFPFVKSACKIPNMQNSNINICKPIESNKVNKWNYGGNKKLNLEMNSPPLSRNKKHQHPLSGGYSIVQITERPDMRTQRNHRKEP